MLVLKLTLVVSCTVLLLQLSTVAAQDGKWDNIASETLEWETLRKPYEKTDKIEFQVPLTEYTYEKPYEKPCVKPYIKDLQYEREETKECGHLGKEKCMLQLTDKIEFQVPLTEYTLTKYVTSFVSLLVFDSEERVWVEASVNTEEKRSCSWKGRCHNKMTLKKPLIGYDMLKSGDCEGDGFRQQPYISERWGKGEDEKEERPTCYMIISSINKQSVSQMYPYNCAEKEAALFKEENFDKVYPSRSARSFSFHIESFSKAKIGNDRKFVCKVWYAHMGYTTSLASGIPSTAVKVYYKHHQNDPWGSPLLNLQWTQFSNGQNKFVSRVSKQHLNSQGVKWKKCFMCEVTINGVVKTKCLNCDC